MFLTAIPLKVLSMLAITLKCPISRKKEMLRRILRSRQKTLKKLAEISA